MKYLKLKKENTTHKFVEVPKDYNELERLIKQTFKVDFSTHKLHFESTPLTSNADYQFLKKQSKQMNNTLKLTIKETQKNYYISFPVSDNPVVQNQAPNIMIVEKMEKKYKIKESKCVQKPQTRMSVVCSSTSHVYGALRWNIQLSGAESMGVYCENTGREVPQGMVEVQPGETRWRTWFKQNGVRRLFGKRFIMNFPEEESNERKCARTVATQNCEEREYEYKTSVKFVDQRNDQVDTMLVKARKVHMILGGELLSYVKFIKVNRLQDQSVDTIVNCVIDQIEQF